MFFKDAWRFICKAGVKFESLYLSCSYINWGSSKNYNMYRYFTFGQCSVTKDIISSNFNQNFICKTLSWNIKAKMQCWILLENGRMVLVWHSSKFLFQTESWNNGQVHIGLSLDLFLFQCKISKWFCILLLPRHINCTTE